MTIIVYRGYGEFAAWDASIHNAMRILNQQNIPISVRDILRSMPTKLVSRQIISKMVMQMILGNVGDVITGENGEPFATCTTDAMHETVMYFVGKKVNPLYVAHSDVDDEVINNLSWLEPFKGYRLAKPFDIEMANAIYNIREDAWSDGTTVKEKIEKIIALVNRLCDNEERYAVIEVETMLGDHYA